MQSSCNLLEIKRLRPGEPGFDAAVGLAVHDGSAGTAADRAARARTFVDAASKRGLRVEPVVGGFTDGVLICAAAALESPGRAALVFLSRIGPDAGTIQCAESAFRSVVSSLWDRRILLLEMLLEPRLTPCAEVAARNGFRRLTRLDYLRRLPSRGSPEHAAKDLRWTAYSNNSHPLFAEAIQRSYAQSLDCPELTGLRAIDDVIAGHRTAGEFDPTLWSVASRNNQPVGVLLLSRIAEAAALEIVYMGVDAEARGTGVGSALLTRAVDAATTTACASAMSPPLALVLAVDERNAPAQRLYARWGFESIGARDAWIATPPGSRG